MFALAESAKSYQPGEIIIRIERPLVQVTKYEHRLFTCDNCFKKSENTAIACSLCQKVYYCSNECKADAWNRLHQLECAILAKHPPMQFENEGIDYMQRLTLRLYLLLSNNNSESPKTNLLNVPFNLEHNGQQRYISQMEAHCEELKNSDWFRGIKNYFKFYQINDYNEELLLKCYGILHINSFGIDCYDNKSHSIEHRGTGLYIEASVFDHSCVPNACASGDGLVLEIRALAPIQPKQLIFIDYVQDVLPSIERKKFLQDRYFFNCQCEFGCATNRPLAAFDSNVDFKRLQVLNNLLNTIHTTSNNERDLIVRSFQLRKQRLTIQEQYYSLAKYHPCLSLFYHELLRFLVINHDQISNVEPEINELTTKTASHLAITHGSEHSFYRWIMDPFGNAQK